MVLKSLLRSIGVSIRTILSIIISIISLRTLLESSVDPTPIVCSCSLAVISCF